jgi:asparagine synthetase B (glutamine-hydrolysing)
MCGFIACKKSGIGTNDFIRRRGEDCTSTVELTEHTFIHNLLSLTGTFMPQPFVDGRIFCVYNGEIYNQPFARSDGEVLIPLYRKYGESFPQHLDGEFSIALYDFENQTAVFSTDAFRSKPVYLNEDGAASYASGLRNPSKPIPFNTTIVRNLKTGAEKRLPVHTFDFDHQEKQSYDDWITAFDAAILKRGRGKRVFLGLSSGYDSGAIHCALRKLNIEHMPFAIMGAEDLQTIRARGVEPMSFTKSDFQWGKDYINLHMEDFEYQIYNTRRRIRNEESAFGMANIMVRAREQGFRIYFSGQGADEIISDYGKWPTQSDFKGKFPERLAPWGNFYGHCQEAYLAKEEHLGGTFSVETRYPFLDLQVVQEFLWLHVDLKNRHYKAPIREYMLRNKYPFKEDDKRGFSPQCGI